LPRRGGDFLEERAKSPLKLLWSVYFFSATLDKFLAPKKRESV
jgi:hypothetical protein